MTMAGWQCPECWGSRVDRFESRFGGSSEDRFECHECGATWHRSDARSGVAFAERGRELGG